jgi:hypothetical protein
MDVEFVAAVRTTVVVHAGGLPRPFGEMAIVVMIMKDLDAEVVYVDVAQATLWEVLVGEVDDAVLDDVAHDAGDVVCFLSAHDCAVAFDFFHIELAQMVGFDEFAVMLDQGCFDGEIDAHHGRPWIIESGFDVPPLFMVAEAMIFELSAVRLRDNDLLVPDQLDAVVVELVVHAIDVSRFELCQLPRPIE